MKIKSTLGHNISYPKHVGAPSGSPLWLTIPAGATLELEDELYLSSYVRSEGLVSSIEDGALVVTVQPVSPLSAKEVAAAIKKQAGVVVDSSKEKHELEALASKLGVDLLLPVAVKSEED